MVMDRGRPGALWFMGSQRVGHDWATELNWTESPKQLHKVGIIIIIPIFKDENMEEESVPGH